MGCYIARTQIDRRPAPHVPAHASAATIINLQNGIHGIVLELNLRGKKGIKGSFYTWKDIIDFHTSLSIGDPTKLFRKQCTCIFG